MKSKFKGPDHTQSLHSKANEWSALKYHVLFAESHLDAYPEILCANHLDCLEPEGLVK